MKRLYILGGGAVGIALAVRLAMAGREVTLVRIRQAGIMAARVTLGIEENGSLIEAEAETVSLDQLKHPSGLFVATTKSFINPALADALSWCGAKGPLCLLQNGLGVERPFLDRGFDEIYRGVLYVTGEAVSDRRTSLKIIAPSLIGPIKGDRVDACVQAISSDGFPFMASDRIEHDVWKKGIINSVFNSICPLLDVDNGIFSRNESSLRLATEVIDECLAVARRVGVEVDRNEVLAAVLKISSGSNHVISTLQDLRNGRPTEIESLNLAVAALAERLTPPVCVDRTRLLGELVRIKEAINRKSSG